MRLRDAVRNATRGLVNAKTRSVLTMLGIVIGIGSVILLMSIGSSAQNLILNQVKSTGSNLIFIIPGGTNGSRFSSPASAQGIIVKTLVQQDVDAFLREPSIAKVSPEVRGQAKAIFENNDYTVTYSGVNGDFFDARNFKTTSGRTFTNSDVSSFNRIAVIGSKIANTLFGERDPIDKTIRLRDITFRVVGVLEEKGLGPFGIDQDNLVLVPVSVAQKQLLGIDYFNSITVQASDAYDIDFAKERLVSTLRQNHRITDPIKDDFTIQTQADALSLLGNITNILTIFLTSIAFISLVVGGIGIMNIMLVSVVERTKEIGLRKALGATNRDILQQFLIEAMLLTLIGGFIGIIGGTGMVTVLYLGLKNLSSIGWVFSLPISAIILAVSVSTFIGLLFGIYPARQAAKKSPIEALRYE